MTITPTLQMRKLRQNTETAHHRIPTCFLLKLCTGRGNSSCKDSEARMRGTEGSRKWKRFNPAWSNMWGAEG